MDTILFNIQNHIATITLNRPQVHHAFNDVMIAELLTVLKKISADNTVRIVILKSQGPVFCAGADLSWMQKMVTYTKAQNKADAQQLAQLMQSLYTLNKPTLAMVQGHAYGGGVGLIACCDIAIATTDARFCFSETKLGLSPSVISPYVIRAIGARQTQRYFLTAETFNANTAHRLGLIHECVADDHALNTQTDTIVQQLLKNGPTALAETKTLLQHQTAITPELVDYTAEHIATLRTSPEGQEGIKAFLANTSPNWLTS